MARLIWSASALADLARLHEALAATDRDEADRAIATIRQAFEPLSAHPQVGPPAEDLPVEFREWPIEAEPRCVAIYRYDGGEGVVILALREAAALGR